MTPSMVTPNPQPRDAVDRASDLVGLHSDDQQRLESLESVFETAREETPAAYANTLRAQPAVSEALDQTETTEQALEADCRAYLDALESGAVDSNALTARLQAQSAVPALFDAGPDAYLGSFGVIYEELLEAIAADVTAEYEATETESSSAAGWYMRSRTEKGSWRCRLPAEQALPERPRGRALGHDHRTIDVVDHVVGERAAEQPREQSAFGRTDNEQCVLLGGGGDCILYVAAAVAPPRAHEMYSHSVRVYVLSHAWPHSSVSPLHPRARKHTKCTLSHWLVTAPTACDQGTAGNISECLFSSAE